MAEGPRRQHMSQAQAIRTLRAAVAHTVAVVSEECAASKDAEPGSHAHAMASLLDYLESVWRETAQ